MKKLTELSFCLFLVLSLLAACNKNKPCLPPQITISGIQTIFAGDELSLHAQSVSGAAYSWTGPNNFSSNQANISIPAANINASGDYTAKVSLGDCENSISKTVEILEKPSCSPTNNTITFFSTMTFNTTDCGINSAGRYEIGGSALQGDFWMEFYIDPLTKSSAIYELSTLDKNSNNVFMQIDIGGVLSNWQATSGKLYVSVLNNQIVATFCNAVFGNIQSTSTKTASGKISCL